MCDQLFVLVNPASFPATKTTAKSLTFSDKDGISRFGNNCEALPPYSGNCLENFYEGVNPIFRSKGK